MKEPIKAVVMLPTVRDITNISKCEVNGLSYSKEGFDPHLFGTQHLYITVDQDIEPIKIDDWAIEMETSEIFQVKEILQEGHYYLDTNGVKHYDNFDPWNCRKIICTTDTSLGTGDEVGGWYPIPQLQQSFLKEYVANPDGEWEVEYDLVAAPWEKYNPNQDPVTFKRLKLNIDNTITITSVEEKMYSREEILESIEHAMDIGLSLSEFKDSWR